MLPYCSCYATPRARLVVTPMDNLQDTIINATLIAVAAAIAKSDKIEDANNTSVHANPSNYKQGR
jgi:hypothetical protein